MIRVLFVAALSADGFIAESSNHPTNWTSKEDKRHFAEITRQAGVVVMGARTFAAIGRALPGRANIVYSHNPIDVPGVVVTGKPPRQLLKQLEAAGYSSVAVIGGRDIFEQFWAAGAVDELYVTVEPILIGAGIPLLTTPGKWPLQFVAMQKLNASSVLLHYRVAPIAS